MEAHDYDVVLLDMIDRYLAGELTYPVMHHTFHLYFSTVLPHDTRLDDAFYEPIIERIENMPEAAMTEPEEKWRVEAFRSWLAAHRATRRSHTG